MRKHERHGLKNTPEYKTLENIKSRCLNKNNRQYKDYGGRGILICPRWLESYRYFCEDMGKKPSPQHSIERLENDKGYYKENCKWATRVEQNRNRRNNTNLELNGKIKTLQEWSEEYNINRATLKSRLKSGLSLQDALNTPVQIKFSRKLQ
jgi:hypothetical protein